MFDTALHLCVHVTVCSPGTHGPGAAGLGKKAWSSEDYSQLSNGAGPACWARVINRNYVTGNLTATIAWNLVDSYYDGLPFGVCYCVALYYCCCFYFTLPLQY